jgi:hypothetical protein
VALNVPGRSGRAKNDAGPMSLKRTKADLSPSPGDDPRALRRSERGAGADRRGAGTADGAHRVKQGRNAVLADVVVDEV